MRPKLPTDTKGYSLDLAEPYIEEDGSPAAALIWNGAHLKLKTLEDWKRERNLRLGSIWRVISFRTLAPCGTILRGRSSRMTRRILNGPSYRHPALL